MQDNTHSGQGSDAAEAQWKVIWLKAIARSWKDAEFEKKLINDPRAALKSAFGFDVPACWELTVDRATNEKACHTQKLHLHLPSKPRADDQAVALAEVAGYVANACCGQPCC